MDAAETERCTQKRLPRSSPAAAAWHSRWSGSGRTGVWTLWMFMLFICLCCLSVELCDGQNPEVRDDLKRRFPNLHKRGLLPGLLGNRGGQPQVGVGKQMGLAPVPGAPGQRPPARQAPPDQRGKHLVPQPNPGQVIEIPMVKYHEIPWKNSVEHNFKWQENQRCFFTCPRSYFVSEVSYRFDTAQSTVNRPWASKQGTSTYTLADKIAKRLSPEPQEVRFRRGSSGKHVDVKQEFLDAVRPGAVNESPITETGCDPILFCLGHQACLFKITVDLCGFDPVPGKRKMFFISVKCTSDSDEGLYGKTKGALELMRREREHVMYIWFDQDHSDTSISQDLLHQIPEDEVFGISCPRPSMALQNGYAGYCTTKPPSEEKMVESLWKVLGRVPYPECRQELVQAYCAYHFNASGGCVPPAFVDPPLAGMVPMPGEIHFSFKAMPRPGPRPDMTQHEKTLMDPHISLIPARIGFLILAHNNPVTLDQLLRSIYRPYFFYVIHVDYRADDVRAEMMALVEKLGEKGRNIRVLPKERSFVASWGSFDIVRAELEGFEELCRMGAWDFVINLSGSDLPLRDVDDTAAMLASARGHNFMRQNGNWKDRSDKPTDFSVWYGCGGHVYNVSYRGKRPDWSDMHSTSQWAIFSRDFIELVVSADRGIFMNNLHFFASTCIIPDESYLASMLKISPFRNTYIHGNLHHLKQFARKDDRGFCRHTEDIDFCGQGPGIFEAKDTEIISNIANQLFFARKFDGNPQNPVRLFALTQVNGQYYDFLKKNYISEEMLRQLIRLGLETEYGEDWEEEVRVEEVLKLRALPMLLPIDPCCAPIYHTKNQIFKDTRYWIDFLVVEAKTGERRALRTSFVPQSRHQCFSRGQIKGLYLTTKHSKDKKTQVQPSAPIPTETGGGTSLYLASYINLSEDMLPAPECNEVENLPDDSYSGRSPDSFSYTTFGDEKSADGHAVHFNASLINPLGEVRCFIDVIITFKKAHPSVQKSDTVRFINTLMCGTMEPGLWTLVLFERGVREPFPYTIQIYLTPEKARGWLEFKSHSDELHGLWAVEQMRELGVKDYPFLASRPPAQPWGRNQGDGGNGGNRAGEVNEMDPNQDDEEEEEGDKYVDEARVDPGGGEDKEKTSDDDDDDVDEGEDDDSSSNDRPKDQIEGHLRFEPNRPQIRAHQGQRERSDRGKQWGDERGNERGNNNNRDSKLSLEMMQREQEGGIHMGRPRRAEGDTLNLSGNRREDRGLRKVKGHNDGSQNLAQIRDDGLPGLVMNQSFAITFLEFLFISMIVFIFVKGVLVPLRIVKRKSHGVKSFATFLVVVTFIQFLVYSMFVLSATS